MPVNHGIFYQKNIVLLAFYRWNLIDDQLLWTLSFKLIVIKLLAVKIVLVVKPIISMRSKLKTLIGFLQGDSNQK